MRGRVDQLRGGRDSAGGIHPEIKYGLKIEKSLSFLRFLALYIIRVSDCSQDLFFFLANTTHRFRGDRTFIVTRRIGF